MVRGLGQPVESVSSRVHLAGLKTPLVVTTLGGSGGWVEARDAGQHPTEAWAAPPKEFSASQQY